MSDRRRTLLLSLAASMLLPVSGCLAPIELALDAHWAEALPEDPLGATLPRTRYVPIDVPTFSYASNAMPGFTTGNGRLGDPINLLLIADERSVTAAFSQAGWILSDPITLANLQHQALALSHRVTYPAAPISDLYVWARAQDFALEKNSDDLDHRDHVRCWAAPFTVHDRIVFLAAGSKDTGIKQDPRTHLPTHAISPDLDQERAYLVEGLVGTGVFKLTGMVSNVPAAKQGQNVGGDPYHSDGNIAVLEQTP